ncbi:transcriptional regulator FeaR [Pseudomonas sp. Tri1]|uniref:transcriptional regulator FeaR n=1 Tax=Pseudomonas sp. Tri1 TaxID=2823875 RepID=UPI001B3317C6|nr:transcriptional regulator FeaR [Pseudomonas sp. Tri1]
MGPTFSSDNAAAFEHWSASLRSACGRLATRPSHHHGLFIGDVCRRDFGGLGIAHVRTNAGHIARLHASADHGDDQYCFLIFQRSGCQRIQQMGQTIELTPGDLALVDSAKIFEIEPDGLIENVSTHLLRSTVEEQLKGRAVFGKLSRNCVSTRLIRTLIHSVSDPQFCGSVRYPQEDGDAMQSALLALLVPALTDQAQPPVMGRKLEPSELYRLVIKLVDEQLQEASLSPSHLARQLNLSVRQLYRLFEEQGETVSRYIQGQRLERVAHDLCAYELSHESITQIAFKWGFFDAAHFSRAFKRHFGVSPRDYRMNASMADQ